MTSSGTINTLDTVAVGIGARKLKYRSIDQVRGLKVGDTVEYETNDKGWIDSIRRIDGDTRKDAPAMTSQKPESEHTAAGDSGGTVDHLSTTSTTQVAETPIPRHEAGQGTANANDSGNTIAQVSPAQTLPQLFQILLKHEGNESRPDSLSFGESTKYPGLKIYFSAQKPEEFPDILDNSFALYALAMDKMRSFREANPDLTNSGKEVKK